MKITSITKSRLGNLQIYWVSHPAIYVAQPILLRSVFIEKYTKPGKWVVTTCLSLFCFSCKSLSRLKLSERCAWRKKNPKKQFWLKICGKLKLVYSVNIVWCVHYLSRPKHLVVWAIRLAQLQRAFMDLVSVWHLKGLVAFDCWCFYTTNHQI